MQTPHTEQLDLAIVPQEELDRVWTLARPHLEKVWQRVPSMADYLTVDDIFISLLNGTSQLWFANTSERFVAYAVTTLAEYRDGLSCDVNLLYVEKGYGELALRWVPTMQDWAIKKGCTHMRAFGRHGWLKVLRGFGFEEVSITMKAPLKKRTLN